MLSGPSGLLGATYDSCSPSPVDPHPTAWYQVPGGDYGPAYSALKFDKIVDGHGDFDTLNGANSDYPNGFIINENGDCVMSGWKTGLLIRVPKSWIPDDPKDPYFPKKAKPYLKNSDGTPWTPGTGPGPGPGGTPLVCPAGQIPDPTGVFCVDQGTGKKVVAGDTSQGVSSWVWIALAAGAGIGGALLLYQFTKPKTVRGAPPAPPPPPVKKEEIVVRR
jgi:hypothetical protein